MLSTTDRKKGGKEEDPTRQGGGMKKSHIVVIILSFVAVALSTAVQADETGWFHPRDNYYVSWDGLHLAKGATLDVPYAATPYELADEMVRLADVKSDDVVYDLGCGDGRLVIAAVKKAGCRGVGIDIDPARIKESRQNAIIAGVQDRVRFVEQNFFESNVREATVMLIYLFPDVNIKLRAKFLKEMKPGSRLVSHAFDMGDWKPDNSASIRAQRVYYWVIPANATGTWQWNDPEGRQAVSSLKMEQKYQSIRGTIAQGGRKTNLSEAKLTGDRIAFAVVESASGRNITKEFSGTIRGNTITGKIRSTGGPRVRTDRWKATRDPSTILSIESGYANSDLLWY
jgi:ubiquinone/menaquinone biosynthesis C-methylase UbiE